MKPPVLIVTYARSAGLIRLLEECTDAGITKFYVAVDGGRSEKSFNEQKIMRDYLAIFRRNPNFHVEVWWRSENLGPAVSVLSGINWLFQFEDNGIILEDDLEPNSDFFEFVDKGLAKYESSENVWIIAGSRLVEPDSKIGVASWSRYPMTWGWATWANKWELMYKELLSEPKALWRDWFNRRANYWDIGSRRSKKSLIDAWDLPLASAQFRLKKLTLIPPVNLIRNLGFDSQATHTLNDQFPLNVPTFRLPVNFNYPNAPKVVNKLPYDLDLDKRVYSISKKHCFLRIWAYLTDKHYFKSIYPDSLKRRIAGVLIPKSSKAP